MSEFLEPVMNGTVHTAEDPKCPFCPDKKKNTAHYRTYKGSANSSSKLAKLIETPGKFGVSVEAEARPKDSKIGKDDLQNQDFKNDQGKRLGAVNNGDKYWNFQAHHAISGNQCLEPHDVQKFIVGGDKLVCDTGYSINNPANGVWLPSAPKRNKYDPNDPEKKLWSQKTEKAKFASARAAMDKFKAQFHLSDHDVPADVDGLDPKVHSNYVDYVSGKLTDIHGALLDWEKSCQNKDKKGKHRGNPRIHNALDALSSHLIKKLKGSPVKWTIFVSAHARDYTRKVLKPNVKLDFE